LLPFLLLTIGNNVLNFLVENEKDESVPIFSDLYQKRKNEIMGILLVGLGMMLLISLLTYDAQRDLKYLKSQMSLGNLFTTRVNNAAGIVGLLVSYYLYYLLGVCALAVPLFTLAWGANRLFKWDPIWLLKKLLYLCLFFFLLGSTFFVSTVAGNRAWSFSRVEVGGWCALNFTKLWVVILGHIGSYLFLITLLIIIIVLITPWGFGDLWLAIKPFLSSLVKRGGHIAEMQRIKKQRVKREKQVREELEEKSIGEQIKAPQVESNAKSLKLVQNKYQPKEGGEYRFPTLDLLDEPSYAKSSVSDEELNNTARALRESLLTFDIGIEEDFIEKSPGPIITRYEFKPAPGIKVNQIVNLADDLALALQARRVRVVAPIPGKAAVGVEIPNKTPQTVYIKDILTCTGFQNEKLRLPIGLGKTISGAPFVADLAKMPHLLIAGATGSGKSVCINVIISSLLYRLHPEEIRFIMIDPKMLELTVYDGIPHLEGEVLTSPKEAEKVLADVVVEMEERYRRLAGAGVRNIEDYNQKKGEDGILPYIVIVVDELADLMMSSSTRTEALITRLAQMARAVGIHLILATQRPSVDVITGLIKANFSARIAFQVASKIDSRTIIDIGGAEKLLGNGDMLFVQTGHPEPRRIHGAFISSPETERIVDFIKLQNYKVLPTEIFAREEEEKRVFQEEEERNDDLLMRAAELVVRHKQGSVSLLQRRLGVGYQRAARLIDQLEEYGVVGPYDGSKAREVLVDANYLESAEFLKRRKVE
jgi:DNA segregation ATPase FtsK/SpoIIIE, S-DNA-T family